MSGHYSGHYSHYNKNKWPLQRYSKNEQLRTQFPRAKLDSAVVAAVVTVVAAVVAAHHYCSGRSGRLKLKKLKSMNFILSGHYGHYSNNERPLQRPLRLLH